MWNFILLIAVNIGLILFFCHMFSNSVENLGERLNLGDGVVGSLLSAVGTALPETMIPIIAVLSNKPSGNGISTGAILGAPFMLSTLGFLVTGLAVFFYSFINKRTIKINADKEIFSRDFSFFIVAYLATILISITKNRSIFYSGAMFLILLYFIYIVKTLKHQGVKEAGTPTLMLGRFIRNNGIIAIILQLILSLIGIVLASEEFVDNINRISSTLGIASFILSMIISPIVTELPEKFNSIMWIRSRKDNLALGNITGAMVFQSTIPVAFGLAATNWTLNITSLFIMTLTLISALIQNLYLEMKETISPFMLMLSGLLYGIFIYFIIVP
ncbi:sodium:calcium antiporter [Clostridium tunisiense]|uniref:sodium:calcium antiporter n=1 Tax=Clostridium tunisiense TaxID=219748 RepID=UPI000303756E|nr:sodium:calcium antiporter [Clostridium tunisiense]